MFCTLRFCSEKCTLYIRVEPGVLDLKQESSYSKHPWQLAGVKIDDLTSRHCLLIIINKRFNKLVLCAVCAVIKLLAGH